MLLPTTYTEGHADPPEYDCGDYPECEGCAGEDDCRHDYGPSREDVLAEQADWDNDEE
jgi:hypothetical protein